ncbi:hypothetical protein GCM10007332_09850 [Epilithonimonas arachidiradicis]|nr:hypothetical protein GCM10007332_09850 [Epilithonimonas arachidiradicis]
MTSALIVGISTINSCSKVDDIIDNITIPVPFDIPVNIETEIPFAVATEYVKSPSIPLGLDLDKEIKERFEGNLTVKSAKLTSFSISQVSSVGGINLKAVSDAELWISAPGQEDKVIATVTNNTSETALSFTPDTTVELMNYLKSTQAAIYIKVKGPENKVDQMKIRINSSFKIQVGL